MYNTVWEGGLKIFSYNENGLEIDGGWLFRKLLSHHNWEIISYAGYDYHIDLHGNYPKGKIIELKKFFYDTYPCVSLVEPRSYSLRIHFKTIINFTYNSLNTSGLN